MKRKTDSQVISAYFQSLNYVETEAERLGGVVYRVFKENDEYKYYVSETGKIRRGRSLNNALMIASMIAHDLMRLAKEYDEQLGCKA